MVALIFRYKIIEIGPSWSNGQLLSENSETCPYLVKAAGDAHLPKCFEICINFCTGKIQKGKIWLRVTLPSFLTWSKDLRMIDVAVKIRTLYSLALFFKKLLKSVTS